MVCFWAFVVIGFPADTAKTWLAERLGRAVGANVSIDELRVAWNLTVRLSKVAITRQGSQASPEGAGNGAIDWFTIRLASFTVEPTITGLVRRQPEIVFRGEAPSGGRLSGAYRSGEMSLVFADLSFKDVAIPAAPIPPAATMSGSGRLRFTNEGILDAEIDGMPGGKQRFKLPGGERAGVTGKVRISRLRGRRDDLVS